MRILITGSNGLLGQKIVNQLKRREKITFLATARGLNRNPNLNHKEYQSLDILDVEQIEQVCNTFKPNIIINTAAMTNVDACEDNQQNCIELNVRAVQYLFDYSVKHGVYFQQLSTDFVFDGKKGNYKETDVVSPISFYGKSKVESENIVKTSKYKNWSIVRTIIILGVTKEMSRSNILLWAKGALEKGNPIQVVDDQFRAPTWADDLAWACIELAIQQKTGVYHVSGPQTLSVLEIVKTVAEHYNLNSDLIKPVSSSTLNQKAKRPPKTGFDLTKVKQAINYKPKKLKEILVLLDIELKQ